VATSKLLPHPGNTNARLTRDVHAGAGAITHYYGIGSQAIRNVPAGSELSKLKHVGGCSKSNPSLTTRVYVAIDYGDFYMKIEDLHSSDARHRLAASQWNVH
jgi:hypothetical protein